jgi:hypothetical protein
MGSGWNFCLAICDDGVEIWRLILIWILDIGFWILSLRVLAKLGDSGHGN